MDQFSEGYAKYLKLVDVQREIQPLCISIQDMLARLDELESVLSAAKNETDIIMEENAQTMLLIKNKFNTFCSQIDSLEKVVDVVQENVNEVQRTVDIAEIELGITDSTLKGLLSKSLFGRNKQSSSSLNTNLEDGNFKRPNIFKTSDYFHVEE